MTVNDGSRWLANKNDFICLVILLAVAFGIGVYLIATTVLIAEDGVTYIKYADKLAAEPLKAMRNTPLHPGGPLLICIANKIGTLLFGINSSQSMATCAQSVSLLSKITATAFLYFIGTFFVGSRMSFWAVLILTFLPDAAEYGSDALSEWPYIMFLTGGFLLLLLGIRSNRWWMFGLVGLTASLGYLVRAECGQLIIYGAGWAIYNFIRPRKKMTRTQAIGALILLLVGFAAIAVPYMRFKGYVFPKQRLWELQSLLAMTNYNISHSFIAYICPAGLSIRSIIGDDTLVTNVCETLMYYFVPGLLIGSYYYFRKQSKTSEQTFFATAFLVVNVALLLWQSLCRNCLSKRHTLALVAFTVFYIPIGLHIIAGWISERTSKNNVIVPKNRQRWFLILMVVGMSICLPKLLSPIRIEKQGYRETANWLREIMLPDDIVAVPDVRIGFYSERKWVRYWDDNITAQTKYVVRVVKNKDEKPKFNRTVQEKYSVWIDRREKKKRLVVYEVL